MCTDITDVYNLIVIGGGSAGLACAKKAASYNKTVLLVDYAEPSPAGTSWGIGGTCLNVGCIPKKLFHQAALLRDTIMDAPHYGWQFDVGSELDLKHNWGTLVSRVQDYISSLRWKLRVELKSLNVVHKRALGTFHDRGTVKILEVDKKRSTNTSLVIGKETLARADHIVIATGMRPSFPQQPSDIEKLCITTDDLFAMEKPPGNTLIIGAGYIGVEVGGFLRGLGFPVTILARSEVLNKFDRQMVGLVVEEMTARGVKFCAGCTVQSVEKLNSIDMTDMRQGANNFHSQFGNIDQVQNKRVKELLRQAMVDDDQQLGPSSVVNRGRYIVEWFNKKKKKEELALFDTVICATGRKPSTSKLSLDKAGVHYSKATGKIYAQHEHTNVRGIYAAGDIVHGMPELTPVAIKSGEYLANRIFGHTTQTADLRFVATTVFTPLEYSSVGLSEEDAKDQYGYRLEVYHGYYYPLEWEIPRSDRGGVNSRCYYKVLAVGQRSKATVVGVHITGPHSGDVILGFAAAIKWRNSQPEVGAHTFNGRRHHLFQELKTFWAHCGKLTIGQLEKTAGIHPTIAEEITRISITKKSGINPRQKSCCS